MSAIHRLLAFPSLYRWFGNCVGGNARKQYVQRYLRPESGYRILDIGCGPGDVLDHLGHGVEYVGVDLSAPYIEAARKRYGQRGNFQNVAVKDFVVGQPNTFDLVMANGLLHHLPDEEVLKLCQVARQALKPGGRLVTLDGCFTPEQSFLARWVILMDRGQFVRPVADYLQLVRPIFPRVEVHVRHDLIRIPYTHLILVCRNEPETDKAAA